MSELSFTVNSDGTISEVFERPQGQPTQGPDLPRAQGSAKREAYDKLRRPQAASVFRMLRERSLVGASWKELWALGEGNDGWDVGPIVVWLRYHSVEVEARYDVVGGETRFYLTGVGVSGGS